VTHTVVMPQLGESVTEGTVGQWLKKVGDSVEEYESLLEVLTDKVNAEVPSPVGGTMSRILVDEGAVVAVGTPICEIAVEGEAAESASEPEAEAPKADAVAAPSPSAPEAPAKATSDAAQRTAEDGRGRYSPAVRRLASEHGIDPGELTGTGSGGRVTRNDVIKAMEQEPPKSAASSQSPPRERAEEATTGAAMAGAPALIEDGDDVQPLSSVRRVIAERMVRSKMTVPHAWLMVEIDVTGLVALRTRLKEDFKAQEGVSLTYLPFMLKAVSGALRQVPVVNAQWNNDSIVMKKRINLGIAMATERGLIVPVVKDADRLSIVGLAQATQDLAKRARSGRLTMDDLSQGTFTVDNTGAVGTVLTYPIINAPEAAIVTMESIVKRPVVVGEMIAIRSMMNCCISFDHRVVDGAEAAQFLGVLKKSLEAYTVDSAL
jgi:2-oxoisovalerate dehydrogenase E2 component (dihydrolipoyl transacylase)